MIFQRGKTNVLTARLLDDQAKYGRVLKNGVFDDDVVVTFGDEITLEASAGNTIDITPVNVPLPETYNDGDTVAVYVLNENDVDTITLHKIAEGVVAQVAFLPVDQTNIPPSRVWQLTADNGGLLGEDTKEMATGESKRFGVDFGRDAGPEGRVTNVTAVLATGTSGGIEIDDAGRDYATATFLVTAVTAGSYTIRVTVTYATGETAKALVALDVA
jgi:hypothetical protein